MERDHIKLKILGDPAVLSPELRELIDETADISTRYEGFQANVCLNYGGRDEIVRAAMRYAEDYKAGKAGPLTLSLIHICTKTAEQTASLIQDRVSLYVNEQR